MIPFFNTFKTQETDHHFSNTESVRPVDLALLGIQIDALHHKPAEVENCHHWDEEEEWQEALAHIDTCDGNEERKSTNGQELQSKIEIRISKYFVEKIRQIEGGPALLS